MEYLTGKLREYKQYVFSSKPIEEVEISRKEAYLDFIYKVFVWEDPTLTWTILLVLHFLFWLIVQLELKLYGIIFLFFLTVFICDSYFEQKGLQAKKSESSDSMRQVFTLINDVTLYLRALRKENPSTFCGTMCMACLVVGFIAKNISGYILTYMSLLTAFFGPLAFSKLPSVYTESIKKVFHTISSSEGVVAENELIPVIANKDERDIDLNDDRTSVADSVTNSLASGISSMPSYLDADGSLDGLDEEDLELPLRSSQIPALNPEYSSDSDSEHKNIHFKSSHFNGDTSSSSEEENCYAKDLQFSDVVKDAVDGKTEPVTAQSIGNMLMTNLTTISSNLVSNVIRTAVATSVPKENSSDSEFEIISDDEIDKQT